MQWSSQMYTFANFFNEVGFVVAFYVQKIAQFEAATYLVGLLATVGHLFDGHHLVGANITCLQEEDTTDTLSLRLG